MYGNLHLRDGRVEFRWKRWRNKKRQEVSCCLMVLLSGMVLLGGGGIAEAGPTGGQVTGGAGSINYGGATTTINQNSQVITINWQTFSTARNETVDFNQPNSSSLAINYVVGGVPSVLQGALNADGRVYILNSAGITFTGTSHVNVGALLATTAMTIDGDPTKKIDVKGSGSGKVINQGSIQVSDGGFAILAAPYVENTGFIKADLGTIALAGTNKFTLDLRGDGLINFVVPPEAVEKIKSDGARVGVNNTGTLQARSGQVLISASVATQVVNAAVNMSGVVDASAFAPNGKGGSVLITSEGDINLSGQVNAAGAGSGAGGQIITKAVGADNINRKAVMTAAGGNGGGQGGQIEVSGHDVLLSGNIDPGAGGSLIIDPFNVTITAANGFNHIGAGTVSENFIGNQLNHYVAVDIEASHNILFNAVGGTHVLHGGNGNLTIGAGSNILFDAKTYEILTQKGFVHLNAGESIGDPGHRLSVVGGTGVTQAGDIVLKATAGDIYLDDVTVRSGGYRVHALFSVQAGGDINATGLIDVEAHGSGAGVPSAHAIVNINAGHDDLLTDITLLGAATGHSPAGRADFSVRAGGNIDIAGSMALLANAIASNGGGRADVNAVLQAGLTAAGDGDVKIAGPLHLAALGSQQAASGNRQIKATADLAIDAGVKRGDVTLANMLVTADALNNGSLGAYARALADVAAGTASGDIAAGEIRILGSAHDARGVRATADAGANLALIAGGGDIAIGSAAAPAGIDVEAHGLSNGTRIARAAAGADLVGQDVVIAGNAEVLANAAGHVGNDFQANAVLDIAGSANGNLPAVLIEITGALYVQADVAGASARGIVTRAQVDLSAGTILVEGPARVDARTTGSFGNFIDAAASLHAVAVTGNASFLGGVEVQALDHVDSAHSANAFANLSIQGAGIQIRGDANEVATVHTHHSMNYITAVALGTLDATKGDVEIDAGNANIIASAIGTQGKVAGGAFAVGSLDIIAGSAAGRILVDGKINVGANAFNPGYPYHAGTFGTVFNQGLTVAAAHAMLRAGSTAHNGGSIAVTGPIGIRASLKSNGITFGSISDANRALGHGEFANLGNAATSYLSQTAAAQLQVITGNGDIRLPGTTVTAENDLIAGGPPVVGKGPYGSAAVGGAFADVAIAAPGGTVHLGAPLAATAMAAAPLADFSANARFEANAGIDVTQAPTVGGRPRSGDFHGSAHATAAGSGASVAIQDKGAPPGLGPAALQALMVGYTPGENPEVLADRLATGDLGSTLAEALPVSPRPTRHSPSVRTASWPPSLRTGGSSTAVAPASKTRRAFPLGP
jgi:filamentous hemagglutinin family protein